MRAGVWAMVVALGLGFVGGWILRSPHDPEGPGSNPAVDSALLVAPLEAKNAVLKARGDSALALSDRRQDSTLKYKDRADSLRTVLVIRRQQRASRDTIPSTIMVDTTLPYTPIPIGPRDYSECIEDLTTVEDESGALREALVSCEANVDGIQAELRLVRSDYGELFAFRRDTVPNLIKLARAEPRGCKENWVLFKVKCSAAGWVKFGGGILAGILVTR